MGAAAGALLHHQSHNLKHTPQNWSPEHDPRPHAWSMLLSLYFPVTCFPTTSEFLTELPTHEQDVQHARGQRQSLYQTLNPIP